MQPTYTILAGSNGAGKSTFRAAHKELLNCTVIDCDSIANTFKNSIPEFSKNIQAGKIAVNIIKECLKNKQSFIQETTLSSALTSNINLAKLQGFNIKMIYIAIKDPGIALTNINNRVSQGGHNIDRETVLKRFPKTYENLVQLSKRINNILILDNSDRNYNPLLSIEKGKVIYKNENIPDWIRDKTDKIIENVKEFNNEKVYKVSSKEINTLMKNNFEFKANPFIQNSNTQILVQGKDIIRAIEKILDFSKDFTR